MDQDMTPAERRRLRTDALEYALRAKNEMDTAEDVIAAARTYGGWIAGQEGPPPVAEPNQTDGAQCASTGQRNSGSHSAMQAEFKELERDHSMIHAAVRLMDDTTYAYEVETSLRFALSQMKRNLAGKIVRQYEISTGNWCWVFGAQKWRLLQDENGRRYPDDPMNPNGHDEIPLGEFLTYLSDWYFPRQRANRLVQAGSQS